MRSGSRSASGSGSGSGGGSASGSVNEERRRCVWYDDLFFSFFFDFYVFLFFRWRPHDISHKSSDDGLVGFFFFSFACNFFFLFLFLFLFLFIGFIFTIVFSRLLFCSGAIRDSANQINVNIFTIKVSHLLVCSGAIRDSAQV